MSSGKKNFRGFKISKADLLLIDFPLFKIYDKNQWIYDKKQIWDKIVHVRKNLKANKKVNWLKHIDLSGKEGWSFPEYPSTYWFSCTQFIVSLGGQT